MIGGMKSGRGLRALQDAIALSRRALIPPGFGVRLSSAAFTSNRLKPPAILVGAHLATATGTPDSSGSNLRLAHICRMNATFRSVGATYAARRCDIASASVRPPQYLRASRAGSVASARPMRCGKRRPMPATSHCGCRYPRMRRDAVMQRSDVTNEVPPLNHDQDLD